MRFVIETTNGVQEESLMKLVKQADMEVIASYEPIEKLTATVEKMRQAFKEFSSNRGSIDVLRYYLKGRGLNISDVDSVISGVQEFFEKAELNID